MSGIFGIFNTSGDPVEADRLSAMSDALVHRGPDDHKIWQDNKIGLGHRMLRTTPEARWEILPFYDRETGLTITSDARLDNRSELIHKLGKNIFKSDLIPDSQIILQVYLKWKTDCVHHLLGDYAFVIWDCRRQTLFCARDHLGVKPFYYYFSGTVFIFCSEPLVIANNSGVTVAINEPRIADHLTPHLEGLDKTSTFYSGVYKLPPAHCLEISHDKLLFNQYWDPQPSENNLLKSDQEYQKALTEILTRSVAERCRGIDNPALLLSGGVDSATILGIGRQVCKENAAAKLHCFSGTSGDIDGCKESLMIRTLAGAGGFEHHCYTPGQLSELGDKVFSLLMKIQEPFDICMVLIFLLYQQAAENGCRVVLDGVDGDMIASLSPDFPAHLLRQGRCLTAVKETTAQSRNSYNGYYSSLHLLCRYLYLAWTPRLLQQWYRELQSNSRADKTLAASTIDSTFSQRVNLRSRLKHFDKENRRQNLLFPSEYYLRSVQHSYLTVGLERYDRVASLCSVEPRHPFINKQLIDFYLGLPWNQFVRDGWSKSLIRRVAEQFIPRKVCYRLGNEHLGGLFTTALLSQKQKVLTKLLREDQGLLGRYIKQNIALHASENYNLFKDSAQTAIYSPIVGLAIWLKHNRE